MSADEFWHGDPNLCKSYRLADEYRKEQRNYELWLQGLYNYRALSASLDAFGRGLSGKKGGKSLEYLEYPIPITKREKEAVDFLLHRRVDGLINMATDTTGAHLKAPLASGIPVLLVDRLIDSLQGKVSAVVIDNVHAAGQAVQKLTSLGHRQIGLILGSPNLYTTNQRLTGYLNALQDAGIAPDNEYIRYGDYTMDGGYQAAQELLKLKNRPTALFVTNFEMTLGTMLALQHNNIRVPEDLSVIGFDKLELFGEIFPDLTLIRQALQQGNRRFPDRHPDHGTDRRQIRQSAEALIQVSRTVL